MALSWTKNISFLVLNVRANRLRRRGREKRRREGERRKKEEGRKKVKKKQRYGILLWKSCWNISFVMFET